MALNSSVCNGTGKKKSTKVGNGGHYLKTLLVQCALAAAKSFVHTFYLAFSLSENSCKELSVVIKYFMVVSK